MKRRTVVYAAGLVAGLLVVAGVVGRAAVDALCTNRTLESVHQPRGPASATLFARRCRASAPPTMTVSVGTFRPFLPWVSSDVFRAVRRGTVDYTSDAAPWVALRWRSFDTLEISYDSAAKVSLARSTANGTILRYRPVAAPHTVASQPEAEWLAALARLVGPSDTECTLQGARNTCASALERHRLATDRHHVTRRGDTLLLPVKQGRDTVMLRDEPAIKDFVRYSYLGYVSSIRGYFVHAQFEIEDAYLVALEASGALYPFEGVPIPSPSGTRLVTATGNVLNPDRPPLIQVWRAEHDSLEQEWTVKPNGTRQAFLPGAWGITGITWLSDTAFSMTTTVSDSSGVNLLPGSPVVARLVAGTWSLENAAADSLRPRTP